MRKNYIKEDIEDFIFYADEFMSYGIYKLLVENNKLGEYESVLDEYYDEIFQAIKSIVETEKSRLLNLDSTYSHNDYFKSERAVDDLHVYIQTTEDINKIENLKRFNI